MAQTALMDCSRNISSGAGINARTINSRWLSAAMVLKGGLRFQAALTMWLRVLRVLFLASHPLTIARRGGFSFRNLVHSVAMARWTLFRQRHGKKNIPSWPSRGKRSISGILHWKRKWKKRRKSEKAFTVSCGRNSGSSKPAENRIWSDNRQGGGIVNAYHHHLVIVSCQPDKLKSVNPSY